jgi:putative endonuclease
MRLSSILKNLLSSAIQQVAKFPLTIQGRIVNFQKNISQKNVIFAATLVFTDKIKKEMKTEKQLQGFAGEDMAVNLLLQKGYRILERNWRCGHLEVDIVAENDDCLVIVEVKTRKSTAFGEPEVFVDRQKQQRLIRAAMYYAKFKCVTKEIRFDVVSVVNSPECQEINHIENAFKPRW